jgi:dynein heavy chain, axonemal
MPQKWLDEVGLTMISSLRQITEQSIAAYLTSPRREWVQSWPGQIVLAVGSIYWTKNVSEAIVTPGGLKTFLDLSNLQIEEIVELVRGKLSNAARATLGAVPVIDVNARDVVQELCELNISDGNDLTWIAQLRYYWAHNPKNSGVKMITTTSMYGYEYLGNQGRLVITPLTDRCYRTLMGALLLDLGGAPEGPAGTGKTETAKDLDVLMLRSIVDVNLPKFLSHDVPLFQGVVLPKLDNTNLQIEEIVELVRGKLSNAARATLGAVPVIDVNARDVVQELCELNISDGNDLTWIAQLRYYWAHNPKNSGVKMITTTSMYGYEYLGNQGRLVITPLTDRCYRTLMGALLLDLGGAPEGPAGTGKTETAKDLDVLMLRSIVDVNLPKFLSHDVPLFQGVVLPKLDYTDITAALEANFKKRNLQCTPYDCKKIIEIRPRPPSCRRTAPLSTVLS